MAFALFLFFAYETFHGFAFPTLTITDSEFDDEGNGSGASYASVAYAEGSAILADCVTEPLEGAGYEPYASAGGGGVADILEAGALFAVGRTRTRMLS